MNRSARKWFVPHRRNPEVAPGIAVAHGASQDDFTLPAALHQDAVVFYVLGRRSADRDQPGAVELSERYARTAVMTAVASFEAHMNQAAFGHARAHADKLEQITIDVLTEHDSTLSDVGQVERRGRFWPLEARFLFLALFLSGRPFDQSNQLWQDFKRGLQIRDRCTHPKPPFSSPTLPEAELVIRATSAVLLRFAEQMGTEPMAWHKASFEALVRQAEATMTEP